MIPTCLPHVYQRSHIGTNMPVNFLKSNFEKNKHLFLLYVKGLLSHAKTPHEVTQ